MDKVGGFVGYLIVNGINMSIELVKQGLSKVHYSGEQGKYASQLLKAQADAQAAKLNIWKDWEPPKEVEPVVESTPAEVCCSTNKLWLGKCKIEITLKNYSPIFYVIYLAHCTQCQLRENCYYWGDANIVFLWPEGK